MKGLTVENIISIYGKNAKEVKVFNEGKRTTVGDFLQIEPAAFALADEKDVLRIYVDERSVATSLDGTLQDVKPEEDGRKKAIKRTRNMVYCFADFMLKEEEEAEKEKAEIEKIMKEAKASGRIACVVSCAENNIRCMHDCMKAANDVVDYLTNKENEVEEWQIAAINAMYDTCKTMEPGQTVIPYDLPYAIKGLLLQLNNK